MKLYKIMFNLQCNKGLSIRKRHAYISIENGYIDYGCKNITAFSVYYCAGFFIFLLFVVRNSKIRALVKRKVKDVTSLAGKANDAFLNVSCAFKLQEYLDAVEVMSGLARLPFYNFSRDEKCIA